MGFLFGVKQPLMDSNFGNFVVVDSLLIIAPIVCGDSVFGPCLVIQPLVSFLVVQSSR